MIYEYFDGAHEVDPVFYARVFPPYIKKCVLPGGGRQETTINASVDVEPIIEAVDCLKTGIKERLQGTGHEELYVPTEETFGEIQQKIRQCADLDTDLEVAVYDIVFFFKYVMIPFFLLTK